ncbi:hypothetical protein A0H76_237 [Hepatospora eriocheir]|uniref:Uncharacterized protein n=1 Tax=Hepatospora eriocheir TaxID=1081669 RepID=A0A1X0QLC6_9MICR|nr:hypothetical protein A0H76_237 [Hepatospora eriocheir]
MTTKKIDKELNFRSYVDKNFIKYDFMYHPIIYTNKMRHYGIKIRGRLFLSYVEVLYLFVEENITFDNRRKLVSYLNDSRLLIYFKLKENSFNVLQLNNDLLVFNKTKDFNRNTTLPIYKLLVKKRIDRFDFNIKENTLIGVTSESQGVFITVTPITLSFIKNVKTNKKN